jgi:hypothetical protein
MSFLALMSRDDLEGIASGADIDPKKPGCGSVGQVQIALKQQGYYEGPLTGALNDEMADAMQAFLADQGMSTSASNAEFCQALRTAQMELSSKARSEVNSRILGVNPILLLLGAAAVAVGVVKFRGGLSSNKGHRVQRNRISVIEVHGSKPWADPWDNPLSKKVGAVVRASGSGAVESDSGAGVSGWDSSYEVPTRNVDKVMSALRRKFRREVASKKLSFRVKRNLRGSAPERGNRGRRR